MNHIDLGRFGENYAKEYLISKKYLILEKNYRNKYGEIDIIAYSEQFVVFVEVKTRKNTRFGTPVESVDYKKQKKLQLIALKYIYDKKINYIQPRFDIIEILIREEKASLNHIKNAF